MTKEKPFASEADLCSAFIDWIDPAAWTAYPETAGWDILLVRAVDGFQIGVQAKMRLNVDVINQTLEDEHSATRPGPDSRAVLVPAGSGFETICAYLGIVVIAPTYRSTMRARAGKWEFSPQMPRLRDDWRDWHDWPEWAPAARHRLPEYVPDVRAGMQSPVQLTDWKIKAIKLAIIVERRGFARREDFKHLRLDHRRWIDGQWLTRGGMTKGDSFPDFRAQHPRVYEEIERDFSKWAPKDADRLI